MNQPKALFDPTRMPTRDKYGFCSHPDFPDTGDEECDITPFFTKLGLELKVVSFEADATEEMKDRYYEDGDADISTWNPTPPIDSAYRLTAIYETEEGPQALYARPIL